MSVLIGMINREHEILIGPGPWLLCDDIKACWLALLLHVDEYMDNDDIWIAGYYMFKLNLYDIPVYWHGGHKRYERI